MGCGGSGGDDPFITVVNTLQIIDHRPVQLSYPGSTVNAQFDPEIISQMLHLLNI